MSYAPNPAYLGSVPSVYNPYATPYWLGYPGNTYSQPTASIPGSSYRYYAPPSGYHDYPWPQLPLSQPWPHSISYPSVNPTPQSGQPEIIPRTPSSQSADFDSANATESRISVVPIEALSTTKSASPSTPSPQTLSPESTESLSAPPERLSASNLPTVQQIPSNRSPTPSAQTTAVETASSPPVTPSDTVSIGPHSPPGVSTPSVAVPAMPTTPDPTRLSETPLGTPSSTSSTALSDAALKDLLQRLIKQRQSDESLVSDSSQGESTYMPDVALAATSTLLPAPTHPSASSEGILAIQSNFKSQPRDRSAQPIPHDYQRNALNQADERFHHEEYIPRQPEPVYPLMTDRSWSSESYRRSDLDSVEDVWDGEASRSDGHSTNNIASELGSLVCNTAKLLGRGLSWFGSDILKPTIKGVSLAMSDVLNSFEEYAAEAELPPAPELTKEKVRKLNKGVRKQALLTRSQSPSESGLGGSTASKKSALCSVFSRRRGEQGDKSSVSSRESGSNAKLTRKQRRALRKQMKAAERRES